MYKSLVLGLFSLFFVPVTVIPTTAAELNPVENHASPSFTNQTMALVEDGRALYETGQFAEAATVWKRAAQNYAEQGDRTNHALSLSYLSLAYQALNRWEDAEAAITKSLALLQNPGGESIDAIVMAQTLNTQGSLLLGMGKSQDALETWEKAQEIYDYVGDTAGSLGTQMNQARALQSLGFYRRSQKRLQGIASQLDTLPNSLLKISILRSLGGALQISGNYQNSQEILFQSLAIARQLNATEEVNETLLALGNVSVELNNPEQALEYFQQAEQATRNSLTKQAAQLNRLSLYVQQKQWQPALEIIPHLQNQFASLSPSRTSIYNRINFADRLLEMANQGQAIDLPALNQLLVTAIHAAKNLKDARSQALALEKWAHVYAQNGQYSEAADLARQSLAIAQNLQADDIIAHAAWQLGRIQAKQGQKQEAIATYTQAVNALQSLRSDLVAINPELQFSFRDSVEPIYREFVTLLLPPLEQKQAQPVNPENLEKARASIEALQLAELDNFFREACLDANSVQIDQIDTQATVIYPILLSDRLATIISSPGKPLRYYATPYSQTEIENTIKNFIAHISPVYDNQERLRLSQQIYDWLIRPAQADGALEGTETLVFVLDGVLRNAPIAALYDGTNYLVEQYNLVLSPGLQLTETATLNTDAMSLVVGGVSESRQGFRPLPAVKKEVDQIAQQFSASVLIDQDFTKQTLTNQIVDNSASIVHLATHGQFSSTAEDTFLLAWDNRLNVQEFDDLLQRRQLSGTGAIELLVLSACETAAGDDRAVLGLAGIAVKSGARSTLATLWQVRDESTAIFMNEFYQQIQEPGVNKAQALRQAQLALINNSDYSEPFFWASFILVGNWQ